MVSACGRASQWRHAVELLGDMQQRHVQGLCRDGFPCLG